MNIEIADKEFILQHKKREWRCISWHPHYIMTEWAKSKEVAIKEGDLIIEKYYQKLNKFMDLK